MGRVKDLTGQRFGRLTVIERRGSDKCGNALWLCKCNCENEIVASSNNLKSGHTTSCGCYKREMARNINFTDLTGEVFGRLTVVKEYGRDKRGEVLWLCRCECGNEVVVLGSNLRSSATTSCGCYQKEKVSETMWKGGITPISSYLRNLPIVEQWLNDCKKQVNYACELTGKVGGKLHTHHLKAFNTIVLEAHKLNNIEIHEIVGEYTQEELYKLEEYVASWHKDTLNAVVLCEEVHNLFHNCKDEDGNVLYGKGNNTPEQFEEFKERYLNGEFDSKEDVA